MFLFKFTMAFLMIDEMVNLSSENAVIFPVYVYSYIKNV